MTDADTILSAEAMAVLLKGWTFPLENSLEGWKLTGGKKKHREFVAKCLKEMADESESEPL